MGLLKKTAITAADDGVQLEKARPVMIYEGDVTVLQESLARIKNEHANRTKTVENPNGEPFSALVLILPLYEGMPSEDIYRERKLKEKRIVDGKETTVETGEVEKYLSAKKYADSATFTLPGFEITEGFKVKAGIRFFEAPPKSASAASGEDGEEDDNDNGEDNADTAE